MPIHIYPHKSIHNSLLSPNFCCASLDNMASPVVPGTFQFPSCSAAVGLAACSRTSAIEAVPLPLLIFSFDALLKKRSEVQDTC
jgi:hypothetical protein